MLRKLLQILDRGFTQTLDQFPLFLRVVYHGSTPKEWKSLFDIRTLRLHQFHEIDTEKKAVATICIPSPLTFLIAAK